MKKIWIQDDYETNVLRKRENKKSGKSRKCPMCNKEIKQTCKDCEITTDKRGGWRQLGVYEG